MKKYLLKLSFIIFFLLFFGNGSAQNQTVANGATTTAINFAANNCGYTWTNDHPEIGLAISGSGDIASFTAVNTGNVPVTATITATPVSSYYAYITNNFSNDVSVINTKTRKVIATISVGIAPFGVSASKDGSLVYITINGENRVAVISTVTNTVINSIPVGKTPYGVVVNPDGSRAYVANFEDNTISVINAANGQVITAIPVGNKPYGVTTSPDGAKVYVTNYMSNTVSVIDPISNSVVATIPVGVNPTGITVGVGGKNVYVSNTGGHSVSVIATANNTSVEVQTPPNPKAIAASPDGSRVFFSTDGFLNFIIPPSNDLYSTANHSEEGVSVTPDGSEAYFVDYLYNAVYIVNSSFTTGFGVQVGDKPIGFGNFISSGPGGCTGAPVTFTITVNPPPVVTIGVLAGKISACAGTASSGANVQRFDVSGTGLTGNIIATAPAGFEVSTSSDGGYSNNLSLIPTAGAVTETIYVRSAATASAGPISGNIVLSSAGMTNKNVPVMGVISALQTVTAVANQVVSNGATTTTVTFSGTTSSFIWTNDHPEIGLVPSGNGNIESFTAVNTGTLPVTATITVTPVKPAAYAYITNVYSNDVSVIDTKTRQVIKTIPVGIRPYGVSASKDGSLVYITLSGEDKIAVISTVTNTVINTIPVDRLPYGIVVNPDGSRIYVTSSVDNTLSVINAANTQIITSIPVGSRPHGVTTSPDGAKVYVANSSSNTVSVIDAITNSVVATIPVGFLPTFVTVGVDGKNVYVSNTSGHSVSVINTADYTSVEVQTPNAPKALVASLDGSRVFFSTDGFLHFITLPGNDLYSTANDRVEGVSVTPDGSEVYFVDFNHNQVYIFNPGLTTGFSLQVGNGPVGFGNFISSGAGSCTGSPITFTITVNPAGVITPSGNPLPLTTSYGTASSATDFNVSGSKLSAPILVTPPSGFEVSTDNATFGNTASINATSGTVTSAPVYIRLKATSSVGNYIGDIQLSSGGGSVNVAMPNSTVTPAPLTVKANDVSKVYGSTKAGGSGFTAFTATGLQNQETVGSVTITYSSGSGVTDPVGVYSDAVVPSLAMGGTFVASNYAINYVNGTLTINASPASIDIPNAFTPNSDGVNDIWSIPALASYNNCLVQVYSRSGEMVFQSRGYAKPWDGTRGGAQLPVGAYYYLIMPRTNMQTMSGQVTIVR